MSDGEESCGPGRKEETEQLGMTCQQVRLELQIESGRGNEQGNKKCVWYGQMFRCVLCVLWTG